MYVVKSQTVVLNKLSISYKVFGDFQKAGQLLLVLHGWNTTGSDIWNDFINSFHGSVQNGDICILTLDLPGFAKSQAPQEIWNVEQYSDFVKIFLAQLGVSNKQKMSILGHSFGGGIATILAAQMEVKHLFLVAPAIVRTGGSKSQTMVTKITKFAKKFIKNEFIKKLWYKLIGSSDYVKTQGIMQDIFRVVVANDLTKYLATVNIPATIIWGDKDTYTPPWQAEIVSRGIKNSKLIMLDDINHGVHIHACETLGNIVKQDLNLS